MARKLRLQYPGAIYHIMSRGDRREAIFHDNQDRERFLRTLDETCQKTGWWIHAYCLMGNHFHMIVETPQPNLVPGMKWLLGVYTSRFNRRHSLAGHLFSGRYKAQVVDGSGNGYLKTAGDYVHLNPVRAGIVSLDEPLHSFPWSSYPVYLKEPCCRPKWLHVERLLGEWGIPQDTPTGRQQFSALIEARRRGEEDEQFKALRSDWCLGGEEFRRELLGQVSTKRGLWHHGPEMQQSAEQKAERIIAEELQQQRWTEQDLTVRAKGDPFKLALAIRLRSETTVTVGWIAQRLGMGARTHLAHLLYWSDKPKPSQSPTADPQPSLFGSL
jgi:REP element-mobilizing transposase RayT